MVLSLVEADTLIDEMNDNVEVVENYLRVKMVEAMKESIKIADQGKFDEARRALDDIIDEILNNKVITKEKMSAYVQELRNLKKKLARTTYNEGRKSLSSVSNAFLHQNAAPSFASPAQRSIVADVKARKNSNSTP